MHLSLSDIPHLPQYQTEKWSTDSVDFSFMSAELLEPNQEVLDIPSERNTLPERFQQPASNIVPGIYLEKPPEYQTHKVLRTFSINSWNSPCQIQESQHHSIVESHCNA